MRIGELERRPVASDRLPDCVGDRARDEVARHYEEKDRGAAPEQRGEGGDDEPDETCVTEMRERDEEVVQRVRPVVDDPALESFVYRDQAGTSCFVDSISCCGLNGLPMKPCAPRVAAVFSDCSSTLPLNMITGIAPTPWRS